MEMADRIVVMNRGVIAQVGTAVELYHRPANRFVAEFVGRMNVLRLTRGTGGVPHLGGVPIQLPPDSPGDVRLVGIRPEHVELGDGAAGQNPVAGTVEKVVFLGNVSHVVLAVGDQRLVVELRGEGGVPARGAPVTVRLHPERLRPLEEG